MSEDNTEYLKKYSERVAMEAEQSDQEHQRNEEIKEAAERERRRLKEEANIYSVTQARQDAAKLQ